MQNKKSQATIIPILGIVIVMLVIIFIYISATQRIQVETAAKAPASIEPIKSFVQQCLDKTAKEGLVLLGKQGGLIFNSQGGIETDTASIDGEAYLFQSGSCAGGNCYVPYALDSTQKPDDLGIYSLTKLRKEDSGIGHGFDFQLEKYIENKIKDCLDFSSFEKKGFEISINENNKKAVVAITQKDAKANLKLPITVKNTVSGDITKFEDFSSSIDVQLETIHNYVKTLIERDISDISKKFRIPNAEQGFVITLPAQSNNKLNNDEVIIVEHRNSQIDGNYYLFQFSRRNRAPSFEGITDCAKEIKPIGKKDGKEKAEVKIGDISFPSYYDPDEEDIITVSRYFEGVSKEDNDIIEVGYNKDRIGNEVNFQIEFKISDGMVETLQTATITHQC